MDARIQILLWVAGAYLVGGVPFGFLIGKMRGVDIRTAGSKNIGATNVYRVVGPKWGFLAFACDFLKGFLPVFAALRVFGAGSDVPVAVGLACVVGHTLTPYMKFKGGKGVATAFGMLMALIPALTGAAFLLFVVVVWLSHYISLGSCLAALFLGVMIWVPTPLAKANLSLQVVMTLLAVFVIWKHRSNIARLKAGTENKIY